MSKGNMGHGGQGEGMGKGGGGAASGYFTFTFSSDNSSVESMTRVSTRGTTTDSRTLDTSTSTFTTTLGTNDLGSQSVVSVEQTHSGERFDDVRVYTDQDGDGQYAAAFDLHVANTDATYLRQHQLTFNTDGSVASDAVLGRDSTWHTNTIDSTETYATLTLGSDSYVVKTQSTTLGYHFSVLRDDNGDGTWTEIASGHSNGLNIDTTSGTLDLVGIQSYLAAADGITG